MLVKDIYRDAFFFEVSSLAHYIYYLLEEKKISLEDDSSKINFNQADHQKVADMIQHNVLGIHKVGIYSLKINQKTFAFIFAYSQEGAIQFFTNLFHQSPLNCHEYPLDFELSRKDGVISFRDMKKEFKSFPALAGCYFRG